MRNAICDGRYPMTTLLFPKNFILFVYHASRIAHRGDVREPKRLHILIEKQKTKR